MARVSKAKTGKLSLADMRNLINKKAGMNVAHDLTEENPTEVKDWIPTGSRWLDSIICRGRLGGIPVGKVVEIAGLAMLRRWVWTWYTLIQSPPLIRPSLSELAAI